MRILAPLVLLLLLPAAVDAAPLISVTGCVFRERKGCAFLRQRGHVYALFTRDPRLGRAMSARVVGFRQSGPHPCMRGTRIEVTSWTPIRMWCPRK
jgi:hypothetical protein